VLADLDLAVLRDFGTALLIGGLIGVEREKRNTREGYGVAGLRSFVLLSQLGAIGGWLGMRLGSPWILGATLLAAAAVVLAGYATSTKKYPDSLGITTELAALVVCLLGALVTTGYRELAIGLAVTTAALLAYKQPLHDLVGRLGWNDVLVGLRLLLATFIVLPLLPNEAIDPWGAINPYTLWLLVLLISGLSLVGYVVTRWLGPGKGIGATAAAGGLVSSTAVTLTFVKQSREPGAGGRQLAGGILLAWGIMFVRVLVAASVVCSAMFQRMLPAFGAMAAASAIAAAVCLRTGGTVEPQAAAVVPVKNPFSLWSACKFAALFAGVQLLLKLGQHHLPASGVYAVAAIAGLTDVDAITLSMAEQASASPGLVATAVTAILVAVVSNTLVKASIASVLGHRLSRPVWLGTVGILLTGVGALMVS